MNILRIIQQELKSYLGNINKINNTDISSFYVQKLTALKEKQLYQTLNKLRFGEMLLVGLFWTPVSKINTI